MCSITKAVYDKGVVDKTKFSWVKSIFYIINELYLQFGIFSQNLFINKKIMLYFGWHSSKKLIRGKSVRFEIKLGFLWSSSGYKFIPHRGKMAGREKSEQVVVNLHSIVSSPISPLHIFWKFNSYYWFCILKLNGFIAMMVK